MYGRYHTTKIFDFEIGYLIKSPCRECATRHLFPGCEDDCAVLDRVQRALAQGVSSTCSRSALESFAIFLEKRQDK